jgi:hypothetical protein
MKVHTVQFVNMSDVLAEFDITGADDLERFGDYIDRLTTFGAASYTMVGNRMFLSCLKEYLRTEQDYTEERINQAIDTFLCYVPISAYINLEG